MTESETNWNIISLGGTYAAGDEWQSSCTPKIVNSTSNSLIGILKAMEKESCHDSRIVTIGGEFIKSYDYNDSENYESAMEIKKAYNSNFLKIASLSDDHA